MSGTPTDAQRARAACRYPDAAHVDDLLCAQCSHILLMLEAVRVEATSAAKTSAVDVWMHERTALRAERDAALMQLAEAQEALKIASKEWNAMYGEWHEAKDLLAQREAEVAALRDTLVNEIGVTCDAELEPPCHMHTVLADTQAAALAYATTLKAKAIDELVEHANGSCSYWVGVDREGLPIECDRCVQLDKLLHVLPRTKYDARLKAEGAREERERLIAAIDSGEYGDEMIRAFRDTWPWFDAMYEKWTGRTDEMPPEPLEAAAIEVIKRAHRADPEEG